MGKNEWGRRLLVAVSASGRIVRSAVAFRKKVRMSIVMIIVRLVQGGTVKLKPMLPFLRQDRGTPEP